MLTLRNIQAALLTAKLWTARAGARVAIRAELAIAEFQRAETPALLANK